MTDNFHEHNHTHDGGEHSHTHDDGEHSHTHGGREQTHSELDRVMAVMGYMLDHNRQHTAELEAMADKLAGPEAMADKPAEPEAMADKPAGPEAMAGKPAGPSQKEVASLLRESAAFYSKGNAKLAESLKRIKEV